MILLNAIAVCSQVHVSRRSFIVPHKVKHCDDAGSSHAIGCIARAKHMAVIELRVFQPSALGIFGGGAYAMYRWAI